MSPRVDVGRRAPPRLRAPPCLQAAPAARSEPARHRHRAGVVAHLERERERGLEVRSPPRSRSTGADNAITRTVPSPASLSLSERRWWPRLLPGEGDAEAPSWGTSVSSE